MTNIQEVILIMTQYRKPYVSIYKEESDEAKTKSAISSLIDTKWSGSNEEKMKAVQLIKGIALSDTDMANNFMKKLDSLTSGLKVEDFSESVDKSEQKQYFESRNTFRERRM